jgi:hypothetical protein
MLSALTTPTREKRKRNETNKRKLQQAIESQTKEKKKDHLKKTSLGPLRQGQRLDTSKTKLCSNKERKPPNQRSKTTKRPPAHMQAPPEPMQLPLDECMLTTSWNRAATPAQLSPVRPVTLIGQTDGQDRPTPGNYTGQTSAPYRSGRCHLENC